MSTCKRTFSFSFKFRLLFFGSLITFTGTAQGAGEFAHSPDLIMNKALFQVDDYSILSEDILLTPSPYTPYYLRDDIEEVNADPHRETMLTSSTTPLDLKVIDFMVEVEGQSHVYECGEVNTYTTEDSPDTARSA